MYMMASAKPKPRRHGRLCAHINASSCPVAASRSLASKRQEHLYAHTAKKLDPQIVGNAGLYFTCYKLSLLGWNVMPTARNARGVDIIAYSSDATQFIGIQVKALSKPNPVFLGSSLDKVMGDFWVVVNNVLSDPSAFILLPAEVRKLSNKGKMGGKVTHLLRTKEYSKNKFRDAWDRIGHGDGPR